MIASRLRLLAGLAAAAAGLAGVAASAEPAAKSREHTGWKDVVFAEVDGRPLMLDLHLPRSEGPRSEGPQREGPFPTVVWVHGGAWRAGSRSDVPATGLLDHGYAVASVDYRLSGDARFPAQIHDIKAAIRYLRTQADRHRLDPNRFAVAGSSAGGHLAALVGVSDGVEGLEGSVGGSIDTSSGCRAIVSFYGGSNLQTILSQSTPHGLSVRVPALQLLLGGQPEQEKQLARLASPVAHVDAGDPPLMLIHGDADPQMPIEQSYELRDAYRAVGGTVEFVSIEGGLHGGAEFFDDRQIERVAKFLNRSMPAPEVAGQ